jgi:N-acetylmuramoyl-L-alanine amidase
MFSLKLPFLRSAVFMAFRLIMGFAAFSSVAYGQTKNAGWDMIKVGDKDYVSLESIKRFYRFTKLTHQAKNVVLESQKVVMKLELGGRECLMNRIKFILSDSIVSKGSSVYMSRMDLAKLLDPVLRPSFIKNADHFRTVILDAGHGGKDAGATNSLGTEAAYNLKLARRLKPLLEEKGFRVKMVRDTDRYYTLQERVNIANAVKEDAVFVSLHFNSGGSSARGIETFTLSPPGVSHYGASFKTSDARICAGNEHDSANMALATALHASVLRKLGNNTFDRGIKRARFSVLSGVRHPAVLFEGGFMSHASEARLIANETYQAAVARGIVDAIVRYRYAVEPKPSNQSP